MGGSLYQIVLYAIGGGIVGFAIAWSIQAVITSRRVTQLTDEAVTKIDEVTAQRDELARENARHGAELKSTLDKSKLLARNVRTLLTERENTKIKLSTIQNALVSLRQKSTALQSEFDKTRKFYKRELVKSFEKRKVLEEDIKTARAEQEAFAKLVESSILDHGSTENMVITAQLRLGQLDLLERSVKKLEAENAQLRDDAMQIKRKFEARERDLRKLEELKLHNKQLVRCVEALEGSRQEYEADAERFREQAGHSEKESDTLRLKLEDLEKNFADIEQQQHSALEDARNATVVPMVRKQS
jgi:vacuolar-type H+-ATPase subunit I/STV1